MLSPSVATLRLFLHVLAATVWVGGQLTLAGLVPGLRAIAPDAATRSWPGGSTALPGRHSQC